MNNFFSRWRVVWMIRCTAILTLLLFTACRAIPAPSQSNTSKTVSQAAVVNLPTATVIPPTPTLLPTSEPTQSPTAIPIQPTDSPTLVPQATATNVPLSTATTPATQAPTALPPTAAPFTTATSEPQPVATAETTTAIFDDDGAVFTVAGVTQDDTLNMRAGPGVNFDVVGVIPPSGQEVRVSNQSQQVGNSTWVNINYAGTEGWVNEYYLAEKIGRMDARAATTANQVISIIHSQDWPALVAHMHPTAGVRFAPYATLSDTDITLDANSFTAMLPTEDIKNWGAFDGEGGAINLSFSDYVDRFVYSAEFFRPQKIGYNETIRAGNLYNNVADYYPNAIFVDYHFGGFDPQFDGLDWRTLRIVLQEFEGTYYVVAIINDEWTT